MVNLGYYQQACAYCLKQVRVQTSTPQVILCRAAEDTASYA